MNKESRFQRLGEYFRRSDVADAKEDLLSFNTGIGVFCSAQLTHINQGISTLVNEGVLTPNDLFADAGSGDGRVVIVTAIYGIPSLGIEYNVDLCKRAESHIKNLRGWRILDSTSVRIIQGDFTKDETYTQAGLTFSDVSVFFNFINNHRSLADKMRVDSPQGTKLLLYDNGQKPPELEGLHPRRTIELADPKDEERFKGTGDDSYKGFLHIYKK